MKPKVKFWHSLIRSVSTYNMKKTISCANKLLIALLTLKVMLHGTIRTLHCAKNRSNVGTMLQPFETMSQQCCNAVLR